MTCKYCEGYGHKLRDRGGRCEDCEGTGKVLCEECGEILEFCECNQTNEPWRNAINEGANDDE